MPPPMSFAFMSCMGQIMALTLFLLKDRGMGWRRQWHPTLVLLPGKSHGRRSLVGCSSWGHWESDTTERLHFHFSLSCIGKGNGNLLQCSCLKNPRDGGAWWASVYGVAQSRTQLKQLSSSSRGRGWLRKKSTCWWVSVVGMYSHLSNLFIWPAIFSFLLKFPSLY